LFQADAMHVLYRLHGSFSAALAPARGARRVQIDRWRLSGQQPLHPREQFSRLLDQLGSVVHASDSNRQDAKSAKGSEMKISIEFIPARHDAESIQPELTAQYRTRVLQRTGGMYILMRR